MPHLIQGIALGNYAYEAGGGVGGVTEVVRVSSGFAAHDRWAWDNADADALDQAVSGDDALISWTEDYQSGTGSTSDIQQRDASCNSELYGYVENQAVDRNKGASLAIADLPSGFDAKNCIIHVHFEPTQNYCSGGVWLGTTATPILSAGDWVRTNHYNNAPDAITLNRSGGVGDWSSTTGAISVDGYIHRVRLVSVESGSDVIYKLYHFARHYPICYLNVLYGPWYGTDGDIHSAAHEDWSMTAGAILSTTDTSPLTATHLGIWNGWKLGRHSNFFVCGRDVTVTNVPTGWKASIDGGSTLVAESGGTVTIDCSEYSLPFETLSIHDADDVEQFTITPTAIAPTYMATNGYYGYGGDVYTCQ